MGEVQEKLAASPIEDWHHPARMSWPWLISIGALVALVLIAIAGRH